MGVKINDLRKKDLERKKRFAKQKEKDKAAIEAHKQLFITYKKHGYIIKRACRELRLGGWEYSIFKHGTRFKKEDVGAIRNTPVISPPCEVEIITTDGNLVNITKKYVENLGNKEDIEDILEVNIELRAGEEINKKYSERKSEGR